MGALEKIKDEQIELLVSAILTLNDREDCYKFFEDICTIAEIKAMAQRIAVAKMLQKGETYTEISEITGASTATISRVKRSLNYG
ncbi:MAG: YerC/YecD family TrpR-related protein, partial [Firmicutes bacterium]|nr:YerC/YecD family TrpR-related protein [Bacillota bacterium]